MLNWNFERFRTRNRLLECLDNTSSLPISYPRVDMSSSSIAKKLFLAMQEEYGYDKTEEEFWTNLVNNESTTQNIMQTVGGLESTIQTMQNSINKIPESVVTVQDNGLGININEQQL